MSLLFNQLLMTTLAPQWGGYEVFTSPSKLYPSAASLYLNHYGDYGSPSFNTIMPFLSKYQDHCSLTNYSSFSEYANASPDTTFYQTYSFNVLMEPDSFTVDFYDFVLNITNERRDIDVSTTCTGTLLGGSMGRIGVDDTAMHPTFRSGVMALTCWLSWTTLEEAGHVAAAEALAAGLLRFGYGTYFNEPSAYLPDWKRAYWGDHYTRLYSIKMLWDPDNVFSCFHCVGSDEKGGLTANPSTIVG